MVYKAKAITIGNYMKINVSDKIRQGRFYLDGGFGSAIIERGFTVKNSVTMNITHPQVVKEIHDGYFRAGSDIVCTNTFGANRLKLNDAKQLSEVITKGVQIARESAWSDKYVGYDCGPLGELLEPFGDLSFDDAYGYFSEQAKIIKDLPVDCVILETFTDLKELKAAVLAFKENTNFPVWTSMSFEQNKRTYTGVSIASFVLTAQGLGVDAIGLNCGLGPELMFDNAQELTKFANVPLFIKPNAGMPYFKDGKTLYDVDSVLFAEQMEKIAKLGINGLGGCCGTTDEFIKRTVEKTENLPFVLFHNKTDAVCSASKIVELKPTLVIGERINPTGKPRLKQALIDRDFDYLVSLASEQTEQGADILDINVGMGGIDETYCLTKAVAAVQAVSDLPVTLDSSRKSALESALRQTVGVMIINSVNGEEQSMADVFPLAKKYGAYIVGLCLDGSGVPETAEERIAIAKRIIAGAEKYGIAKDKLLIDALTMAVSVNKDNAQITAQTVKRLHEELGVKTVLGLSNVSFGLPNRNVINGVFYDMMIKEGLTCAIINPSLKVDDNKFAYAALKGLDEGCQEYIKNVAGIKEEVISSAKLTIYDAVLKGLKGECLALFKRDVNESNFMSVINDEVIRALNDLGQRYEDGKAFLPQLIAGAESAKTVLDEIKAAYMKESGTEKAIMLIATVKGDVHDIGKNIVKAVLSNYGYKIIDLGKDVGFDKILENIKIHHPSIVGLSALMTTTLDNMAEIVKQIKSYDKNIVVAVGGAVVTQSFADMIGADIYSKDAQEAVRKLNEIYG